MDKSQVKTNFKLKVSVYVYLLVSLVKVICASQQTCRDSVLVPLIKDPNTAKLYTPAFTVKESKEVAVQLTIFFFPLGKAEGVTSTSVIIEF